MPFNIEISDALGNTLEEISCSIGVIGYWSDLASESNLPILKKLYERSFIEGSDIYDDDLKNLLNECLTIKSLIEENSENSLKKDGILAKISKSIDEHVDNKNLSINEQEIKISQNVSILNTFIRFIEIAIERDGSINIS